MNNVLIIGKPNSGKSLLFNRLTGLEQKVANFPGVTVEIKTGRCGELSLTDYPGIYSFQALTRDEQVAIEKFQDAVQRSDVKAVICVLDATRLERSLVMGLQAQTEVAKMKKPILFVLNMMDELLESGSAIDIPALEKDLGSPVVGVSAKKRWGLELINQRLCELIATPDQFTPTPNSSSVGLSERARRLSATHGPKEAVILKRQNRLDSFFLSSSIGGLVFGFIMLFIFQSIFTWAVPLMDSVEWAVSSLGGIVSSVIPDGVARDFVYDAIFGGFGSFLVFVPQIFILTFLIGLLEDSGYLARAAIICHRPLSLFGLTGKSFVPLLTGHACAIPAMMAARTIESPKKRLLTIIALPLMSCSARLPVYSLLIVALIPPTTYLGGLVGLQGMCFFALFLFGLCMALIVSGILSKTLYKDRSDAPFIVELPPYRVPHWRPLLRRSMSSAWSFVTEAGLIIFVVTVVVWILGYFPNGEGALQTSWLASLARWIEPVFEPLGLDWRFGVAILTSFLAREVFVSTLGTFFGIEGADEHIADLAANVQSSGVTLASALALLVFYAIALQCASTLAVMKKETGDYRLPGLLFVGYGLLAYALAWVTYTALQ